MATKSSGSIDFLANLGKVYGIYTGGFLAFVILLAVLEQVGVPNKILGYLFVFFTLAVYAIIGVLSRTAQVSEYYVAGRSVPAFYNGMATGADWMSRILRRMSEPVFARYDASHGARMDRGLCFSILSTVPAHFVPIPCLTSLPSVRLQFAAGSAVRSGCLSYYVTRTLGTASRLGFLDAFE